MLYQLPLPDEFYLGYSGRLARSSGCSSLRAQKIIAAKFPSANPAQKKRYLIELLAQAANADFADFVLAHTLLPYQHAIRWNDTLIKHGEPKRLPFMCRAATRILRPGGYLCAQCIADDFELHGPSYWRRAHQLPGIYLCSDHRTPLHYLGGRDVFDLAPSAALEFANSVGDEIAMEAATSPFVSEFVRLSNVTMTSKRPLSTHIAYKIFNLKESRIDYTLREQAPAPHRLLSDQILAAFPRSWLEATLPETLKKKRGQFSRIDRVLLRSPNAGSWIAYLLAFCVVPAAAARFEEMVSSA
ncbi:TniQ family protein [Duganella sp. BJB476]|uniref:TniQ family protein n=1 Tax=Duganella sp. BJB476 TaxID=1871176 RepID=UPI000E34AFF6|nr:hypothetical protein D0T21_20650 [Duganella sp. BJB476]